jgi:hypothetical protein
MYVEKLCINFFFDLAEITNCPFYFRKFMTSKINLLHPSIWVSLDLSTRRLITKDFKER